MPRFRRRGFVPLSVVIPLGSRDVLAETLAACGRNAASCELELIVVHNSPPPELPANVQDMLANTPNLSCQWIAWGQRQDPRSLGAQASRYDHVLFLGDDVHPMNEDFFRVHAALHSTCPQKNFVVLGSVMWPDRNGRSFNLSLGPILAGGKQAGLPVPSPLTFLDYRYFADSNVSVKKSLVHDWNLDGFSPDFSSVLGGVDLAYRLSRQCRPGLRIFYDPAALGAHEQKRTLGELLEHQVSVGRALKLLVDRYPEMAVDLGLRPYIDALNDSGNSQPKSLWADYASTVEGIKAWVRIVDDRAALEAEPWHAGLRQAVFELCLLQGLASSGAGGTINPAAGSLLLARFMRRLRQVLHEELSEHARPLCQPPPHGEDQQTPANNRRGSG